MSRFRSYCPSLAGEGETFQLDAFESHHLVAANRARTGDVVTVFDGKGMECSCRMVEACQRNSRLKKLSCAKLVRTGARITLAQAVTKGKTMDSIVRRATELGVFRIQPILSRRIRIPLNRLPRKMDKWRQQCIEACKQSGNGWLPHLSSPVSLEGFVASLDFDLTLVASLRGRITPWQDLDPGPATCALIIGPEGDFSREEYDLLHHSGAVGVSLGRHVLRSETAAVAALALANQFL